MQSIKLDISQKNNVPHLYVKQRDVRHKFAIELYENGVPYTVDENNTFAVWYSGASGEGNYTEIGDETACIAEGNKIIVQMIMQMLQNPGDHEMCVVMYGQDNEQKGFWNVSYYVEEIPGADSEGATAYYNAFLDAQKKAEEAAEVADDAKELAIQSAQMATDAAGRSEAAAERAEAAAERAEAGAGASIIVSLDEGNMATHTALEIYNAMQNHQIVVFCELPRASQEEFIPIRLSTPSKAVFSKTGYPAEFDSFDIKIDGNGQVSYETHFGYDLVLQSVEKVETDIAPVSYLPQTLNEEQQAQARENIGAVDEAYVDNAVKGKTYALIEEFTLEEEVTSIVRTNEPDGTPYNFSAIRVYVKAPANTSLTGTKSANWFTKDSAGNFQVFLFLRTVGKTERRTVLVARNDGGRHEIYAGSSEGANTTECNIRPHTFINEWANVAHFEIDIDDEVTFPIGTKITIYGIRG